MDILNLENELLNTIDNKRKEELKSRLREYNFYLSTYNYDKLCHQYLIILLTSKSTKKYLSFINSIEDVNIKNQIKLIDDIIFENNLLNKRLFMTNNNSIFYSKLESVVCNNQEIITNKIKLNSKISPIRFKQYYSMYDDKYLFNTYQCYFKSSIYFFLTNGDFINTIINTHNKHAIKHYRHTIIKDSLTSNIIDTDKIIGGSFNDIVKNNINNNNILSSIRAYLNIHYDNKYLLSIPGIKVYPSIVINDILKLEHNFSNKCLFKIRDKCYYIYDATLHFTDEFNNPLLKDVYDIFKSITLDEIKNETYYDNIKIQMKKYTNTYNISDMIHIDTSPRNLLIHSPIFDPHGIFMINNVVKILSSTNKFILSYNVLKNIFNIIKNVNVKVKYNKNIIVNDNKYYLHSFIICNSTDTIDSHFVYYKRTDKYYDEIKITENEDIIDNPNTRVCFVCYRKR